MAIKVDHGHSPGAHGHFMQPGTVLIQGTGIGIDPGPPEPTGFFLQEVGGFMLFEDNGRMKEEG